MLNYRTFFQEYPALAVRLADERLDRDRIGTVRERVLMVDGTVSR